MGAITLDREDKIWAATVGVTRKIWWDELGKHDIFEHSEVWLDNIEGAMAELAYARWRGVEWPASINTFSKYGDVGGEEIRWTKYECGHLPLQPHDKPNRFYWLVTGEGGYYKIRGRIQGAWGITAEFWDETQRHPCYMVPQHRLVFP